MCIFVIRIHAAHLNTNLTSCPYPMKPYLKLSLIAVVITLFGIFMGAWSVYFKPHRDIRTTAPDYILTQDGLVKEFTENDSLSNKKYSGKVLEITGHFHKMEGTDTSATLVMDNQGSWIISASFLADDIPSIKSLKAGDLVRIKGLYDGYLEEDIEFMIPGSIQLSKCSLVK